jgi:hypothetical protein
MQQAHLIPRQLLRRNNLELWNSATWVWACASHHAAFDFSRSIRVARKAIPQSTEQFAKRHEISWYLDKHYK